MSAPAPSPPAGAAPEPAPVELTQFFCYQCASSVSVPVAAEHPTARLPLCPLCRHFLEPTPTPSPLPALDEVEDDPPPPPPGYLSGSEDSDGPVEEFDELNELDDIDMMAPADARVFITNFIQDRLSHLASPDDIAAATAAALALLDEHVPVGEPPAPAASIAVLPTVEVSDLAATCSICREDLPLGSAVLKLPCSHFFHSSCVVPWLQMHNSCPLCRSRLPVADHMEALPAEQDLRPTHHITIRLTTTSRRRVRANDGEMFAEGPISASATQFAQVVTGGGGDGPANSGETVSSEWPPQPESDTVMSEARDGEGFFD